MRSYLSIFRCRSVRVSRFCPTGDICNSISIQVHADEGGGALELALFGLPEDVVNSLLLALADEDTIRDDPSTLTLPEIVPLTEVV